MPAEILNNWLKSGKPAALDGQLLRPLQHPKMPGMPLVVQRGQANALFCRAENNTPWIIKKFLPGRGPDATYLGAVAALLPAHPGFAAGKGRRILQARDLQKAHGAYFTKELQEWIGGTVLMPRIAGTDWAGLADDVRSGDLQLEVNQRISLVRNLSALAKLLEDHRCAHRDFSCTNVFIVLQTGSVCLIDFDTLYHPSLIMPRKSPSGTPGYIAPFVWRNGLQSVDATWHPHADRFALALLNVEFLVLDRGTPLHGDGGMFPQAEIRTRQGRHLAMAMQRLRAMCPGALPLFEAAISSRSYDDCPAPEDWTRCCSTTTTVSVPSCPVMGNVDFGFDARTLQRKRLPGLDELPWEPIVLPATRPPAAATQRSPAVVRPPFQVGTRSAPPAIARAFCWPTAARKSSFSAPGGFSATSDPGKSPGGKEAVTGLFIYLAICLIALLLMFKGAGYTL